MYAKKAPQPESVSDNNAGTITPGRSNTAITTAATTAVVAAPAAGIRDLQDLKVSNNNATASCVVTVQQTNGSVTINLAKVTLLPGENLCLMADGSWRHYTAFDAEYGYLGPAIPNLGITGTKAETLPRENIDEAAKVRAKLC